MDIAGITLKNPVMPASGTFGSGEECKRLDEAGMDYNFFCLAGIYGSGRMEEVVKNTAEVFSRLRPKVID